MKVCCWGPDELSVCYKVKLTYSTLRQGIKCHGVSCPLQQSCGNASVLSVESVLESSLPVQEEVRQISNLWYLIEEERVCTRT